MKKITVVFVALFSFIFCPIVLAVAPSKGKVIGKPANKNWIIKMGEAQIDERGPKKNVVLFSEDGGKSGMFFIIATYDGILKDSAFVWSPDGKYLMILKNGSYPKYESPRLDQKKGYWLYDAHFYDAEKRIFYSLYGNIAPSCRYVGSKWVKGSKNELEVEYSDCYYPKEQRKIKTTLSKWDPELFSPDPEPSLAWLVTQIGNAIVHKDVAAVSRLLEKVSPSEESPTDKETLIEIVQDSIRADRPTQGFDVDRNGLKNYALYFSYGYNRQSIADPTPGAKMGCYIFVSFKMPKTSYGDYGIKINIDTIECE